MRARRDGEHRTRPRTVHDDDRDVVAGIVMFVRALPSLKKGDTVANIGVVKKGE